MIPVIDSITEHYQQSVQSIYEAGIECHDC